MSTIAHFSLDEYERTVDGGAFAGRHHQGVELIRGRVEVFREPVHGDYRRRDV